MGAMLCGCGSDGALDVYSKERRDKLCRGQKFSKKRPKNSLGLSLGNDEIMLHLDEGHQSLQWRTINDRTSGSTELKLVAAVRAYGAKGCKLTDSKAIVLLELEAESAVERDGWVMSVQEVRVSLPHPVANTVLVTAVLFYTPNLNLTTFQRRPMHAHQKRLLRDQRSRRKRMGFQRPPFQTVTNRKGLALWKR
jgi:hypothetical protein